jgi:hypothetical protein
MHIIALLTKFAENAHHRISISEMIKNQPEDLRQAFLMNSNAKLRNILGGQGVNFADRDRVVAIER